MHNWAVSSTAKTFLMWANSSIFQQVAGQANEGTSAKWGRGLVVRWLACWTANREVRGSNPTQAAIWIKISAPPVPQANSAIMSTLTAHYKWEDEMVRKRTIHLPSSAEAKKMKLLTLHTQGCPRASLMDCSSFLLQHFGSLVSKKMHKFMNLITYKFNLITNKWI